MKSLATAAFLLLPLVASAETVFTFCTGDCSTGTLGGVFETIFSIINDVLVPLIFAIAFIVFLYGVFKYFIAGATEAEDRQKGTQLILYGIIGFAIMISVWGLVNVVSNTFGLSGQTHPPYPTL